MAKIKVEGLSTKDSEESIKKVFSKFGNIIKVNYLKNKIFNVTVFIEYSNKHIPEIEKGLTFSGVFNGKQIKIRKLEDNSNDSFLNKNSTENSIQNVFSSKIDQILPEGSLEVTNFNLSVKTEELRRLFGFFGYITKIFIKKVFSPFQKCKSVFVCYGIPECAIKAACYMEKKTYKGKILMVRKINTLKTNSSLGEKSNFKFFKKLQSKYKNQILSSDSHWMSLFVDHETVLTDIKRRYSKNGFPDQNINNEKYKNSQFLISRGRILWESKKILENEGLPVQLFQFSNINKKSRRCFFIKYRSYQERLLSSNNFKKFGQIKNFYFISKAKLIIIEYKTNFNAALAFEHIKNSIIPENEIFIEWIPLDFIKNNTVLNSEIPLNLGEKSYQNNRKTMKNLNRNSLKSNMFLENSLLSLHFPKKLNFSDSITHYSNSQLNRKSMGNQKLLNGKIIVRNIPFKLKLYDLRKIFTVFGKILSIRIPKKKNGDNRGFAFIEYQTLNEAKKALFLIQNIQLQSRSLKINLIK